MRSGVCENEKLYMKMLNDIVFRLNYTFGPHILTKTVPKIYVFCSFSPTSYFQLHKHKELTVLDLPPMLNHEIDKE